jgi:hypothetical protein
MVGMAMTKKWVMGVVTAPTFDKADQIVAIVDGTVRTSYLAAYDPDGFGGRGRITFTEDIAKAKRYATLEALFEEWRSQSTTHPLRSDGKPNRPLTAHTIVPRPV